MHYLNVQAVEVLKGCIKMTNVGFGEHVDDPEDHCRQPAGNAPQVFACEDGLALPEFTCE